jgi:chemotaxis protein CheY-P-specific phosphatase CheC
LNTPFPVIICDDSNLARKQMAHALDGWNVDITFAQHGAEALEAIRQGKGDLLFLDLNMPVMDGYELLERIQHEDLPTMVLVVSGDIQPDAYIRVKNMGAIDFIKKPINTDNVTDILHRYGLLDVLSAGQKPALLPSDTAIDLRSYYQELSNIAMGHAADRLARLLNVFIQLPIPRVALINIDELDMILHHHSSEDQGAIVSQGFISSGIAGEVLLMFSESSIQDMAKLLKYEGDINVSSEKEILIDLANVLSGAFLNSLAHQLDIIFSQNSPVILSFTDELTASNNTEQRWDKTLSIEISYRIEEHNISCDLLLLFTEDSLDALNQRTQFFQ